MRLLMVSATLCAAASKRICSLPWAFFAVKYEADAVKRSIEARTIYGVHARGGLFDFGGESISFSRAARRLPDRGAPSRGQTTPEPRARASVLARHDGVEPRRVRLRRGAQLRAPLLVGEPLE